MHVKDALRRAGVPASYWTPAGSKTEYWDLVNRLADARREFGQGNYAKVLEILEPVKLEDVDVAYLRGWSNYRLGLYSQAAEDFQGGLKVDPHNLRNLGGLGFCYLQQGNPVLAQRKFNLVLERSPNNKEALVGQGLAFLRLQNKAAAERMFREVLEIDPGNAEVEGYLKRAEAE
jgi:Flp pilus assembly protein TadD